MRQVLLNVIVFFDLFFLLLFIHALPDQQGDTDDDTQRSEDEGKNNVQGPFFAFIGKMTEAVEKVEQGDGEKHTAEGGFLFDAGKVGVVQDGVNIPVSARIENSILFEGAAVEAGETVKDEIRGRGFSWKL